MTLTTSLRQGRFREEGVVTEASPSSDRLINILAPASAQVTQACDSLSPHDSCATGDEAIALTLAGLGVVSGNQPET